MIQLHVFDKKHTLDSKIQTSKSKRWIKIYHAKSNHKNVGVATLISDIIDFKKRNIAGYAKVNIAGNAIVKGTIFIRFRKHKRMHKTKIDKVDKVKTK